MVTQPVPLDPYTDDDGVPRWDCPDCGTPFSSAAAASSCCQD